MPRRAQGFTLVEVMVVMLIVGIIFVGGVVMLERGLRGQLEDEVNRFNALFELVRNEAMVNSSHRGLGFQRDGYGFYRLSPQGQWLLIEESPLLLKKLGQGLEQRLYIDGLQVSLPLSLPAKPQVWMLASGETRPFELALTEAGGEGLNIRLDAFGRRIDDEQR